MIFLRPIVVRDASIDGDLADYRRYLPGANFFPDERIMGQKFDEQIDQMRRCQSPRDFALDRSVPQVPPPSGGRP